MTKHPSQAGYAEEAEALIRDYESRTFEETFATILHLFPEKPCRVLDIGAGTGRHAAALAGRGHETVAVEPTRELREAGRALHGDMPLTWIDDALPELESLGRGPEAARYGLVLLAAVLMHFDGEERRAIIRRMAELLEPGGRAVLSLRHGPVPPGRRMFPVSHEEVTAMAEENGMRYVGHAFCPDHRNRPGVHWTMLCLDKPADNR